MDARTEAGSPDRFGYLWERNSHLSDAYRAQYEGWVSALPKSAWNGATFLDAGCGMGRNSYWSIKSGAAGGVAIDVDNRTVEAARETLRSMPGVEVRCQSIYEIGDRDRFDIAFSIGVIHHLENPEAAVRAMVRATKPGGSVLVWLYGYENNRWIVWFISPLRRHVFSKLPIGLLHALAYIPSAALWLMLRAGVGRIEYYRQLRGFSFKHLFMIVFDQLLPKISRHYKRDEAMALLTDCGLADVRAVWVNEMSWSVSGRRPVA